MKLLPAVLLCLASIPVVAQDGAKSPMTVHVSGSVEKDGDMIRAYGGVKMSGNGWTLQADSTTWNTITNEIRAHGNVTLKQGDAEAKAEDLTFNPAPPKSN